MGQSTWGQIKNIKLHIVTDIKLLTSNTNKNKMVYDRFIHAGRVVYVANGKYAGKLVVVADIVDHGRALCENPVHGIVRQVFRFQDLNITDIAVKIKNGARGGAIRKQYVADDVDAQWAKTAWAKKIAAREEKRNLSDFGRFKAKVAKQQRARKIKAALVQLKKQ